MSNVRRMMMRGGDSTDWKALLMILLQGDDYTLTELVLPEGINRLHAQAISGLRSCTTIDIPSTITFIDNWNFITCNNVTKFIVRASTPPSCAGNALVSLPAATNIYVPDSSVAAYQSASSWSARASRIFPMSDLVSN